MISKIYLSDRLFVKDKQIKSGKLSKSSYLDVPHELHSLVFLFVKFRIVLPMAFLYVDDDADDAEIFCDAVKTNGLDHRHVVANDVAESVRPIKGWIAP